MSFIKAISLVATATFLTSCQLAPIPTSEPAGTPAVMEAAFVPSAESNAIRTYYKRVENDLLVRGLMRTDGGGPDTPVTPAMLARNFERITFYDEHTLGRRLERSSGAQRRLTRWDQPVRIAVEFGPSVSEEVRANDGALIRQYAGRLSRVTGHPISTGRVRPNFHVLVAGEDDRTAIRPTLKKLLPSLSVTQLAQLQAMPRETHCLVIVSHADGPSPRILQAVAIVRAEHPDLLRRSCYHEELAQGLGLVNDSPYARPSIFNDDDEFALLTTHDEALLSMLYDSRLSIGMSAAEARPIVETMARELLGKDV